jgi:hypothetical protein
MKTMLALPVEAAVLMAVLMKVLMEVQMQSGLKRVQFGTKYEFMVIFLKT